MRHRFAVLATSLLASLVAVFPASQLSFNQSIESLYADDDPHLQDYLASRRWFGGDELVGVCYTDSELFEPAGLERVNTLATALSEIPGVQRESTQDLALNLEAIDKQIFKLLFRKQIATFREQALQLFRRVLVGDDNRTTAVIVRLVSEGHSAVSARADYRRNSRGGREISERARLYHIRGRRAGADPRHVSVRRRRRQGPGMDFDGAARGGDPGALSPAALGAAAHSDRAGDAACGPKPSWSSAGSSSRWSARCSNRW